MRKIARISVRTIRCSVFTISASMCFSVQRFVGPDRINVGDKTLNFRRAILATGTRATIPPIPGLAEVGSSRMKASLLTGCQRAGHHRRRPHRLRTGAGVCRFGSRVTLVCNDERVLRREDAAWPVKLPKQQRDGVDIRFSTRVLRAEKRGGLSELMLERGPTSERLTADAILVAWADAERGGTRPRLGKRQRR